MKTAPRKADPRNRSGESLDTFYKGRVLVLQKKRGYRFALDAPLLADFIETQPADELLELGTGNAVISLLLSLKPFRRITALEIQRNLAELARRNIELNKLGKRIRVIRTDFRTWSPAKKFDVVFSNPPYIPRTSGFLSASREKSIAKHEIKCDILDVMRITRDALKPDGRAYFIYPAKRETDFVRAAATFGLSIRALRYVQPRSGETPNLFLAECGCRRGRRRTLPPLILYDARNRQTKAARRVFEGRTRGPAR